MRLKYDGPSTEHRKRLLRQVADNSFAPGVVLTASCERTNKGMALQGIVRTVLSAGSSEATG